ncbi:hypothetical protein CJJ09_004495 [Candidozyma auris]|nr:hypothetical protein CJJ09_004495 [[Candida] auris]
MSVSSYKSQDPYSSASVPDKMAVFQECLQQFNASPVDAKKSVSAARVNDVVFSISKLFQHKNSSLRQLVYLTIKELSATSQDILMVTSSIMKDIQSGSLIYKPNAIRTLSKVLDPTTVSASERLFKNCLVDKNPIVSSAALISSYNLLPIAKDVVKRFTNETLETIQSYKQFPSDQFQLHEYYGASTTNLPANSYMYQYHALGLLYQLRNHDKMYINKVLLDDESLITHLHPILAGFLKHKSDMVELEACKTLIGLQHLIKEDDFMNIILTLQKLLSVPRTATRFAAVRLINKISIKHPEKIMVVNLELEGLINDSNRSVSTLAITTLLKTLGVGTVESASASSSENVDRLISKMTSMMDEITEDFKITIIEAIENLALKFPSKHKKLVSFLSDLLRDDGTLQLKSSIVDALFDLIKFLSDKSAKQLILMNLCEFIEDCEYTELSVRILHLLGDEGPATANPSSSAVIALSKFAVQCDETVAQNVKILLSRCLNDVDDEVRDRASLSLSFIDSKRPQLVVTEVGFNLAALESKLSHYLNDESNFGHKFDIDEIPLLSKEEQKSLEYNTKIKKLEKTDDVEIESEKSSAGTRSKEESQGASDNAQEYLRQQEYAANLSSIPEFAGHGKLTSSSASPLYLTDRENEFVVTVVKHFFVETQKLILQFDVTNTLSSLVLQDVSVVAQPDNELYEEEFTLPLAELKPEQTGSTYVSFNTPAIGDDDLLAAFGNTLIYTSKDTIDEEGNIDPADEGIEDEYQIDDLEVTAGDFIQPMYNSNFTSIFDQLPESEGSVVTIGGVSNLENAVNKLKKSLNAMPLDGSDYVPADSTAHVLKLLGKDLWGGKVGVSVRLAQTQGKVVAKLQVKGETPGFAGVVANGVQ